MTRALWDGFIIGISGLRHRLRTMPVRVHLKQAIYGSFAARGGGYALTAHSPGCKQSWLGAFQAACERFGERPRNVCSVQALIARPINEAVWMVARVEETGIDDRGRPGALGFHALFLSRIDYQRLGAAPFPLQPFLGIEAGRDCGTLAPLSVFAAPFGEGRPDDCPDAPPLARALQGNLKQCVESEVPIDGLAARVWAQLPLRVRMRRSLATWVFANAADYDLAATPPIRKVT